jgi:5-methylcytosine-specific restriction endonuclease McrA
VPKGVWAYRHPTLGDGFHPNADDLTGRRFGKLTALRPNGRSERGYVLWNCQCDCGAFKDVEQTRLTKLVTKSCGCDWHAFTAAKRSECAGCGSEFMAKFRKERGSYERACSRRCALKIRDFWGEKNPNWRDDSTRSNIGERFTHQYQMWRMAVFTRDKSKCVLCGSRETPLHADHIKSFAHHPDLRLDVDNGRTLCKPCHLKTENYGRRHAPSCQTR